MRSCNISRGRPIGQLSILFTYLRLNRNSYFLGTLFLLGTNAFGLLIPWLLKMAVDSFQSHSSAGVPPAFFALLIIIAALMQGVIRIFLTYHHPQCRPSHRIPDPGAAV